MLVSQAVFPVPLAALKTHCRMDFAEVTCPTCFEHFSVALPAVEELPCEVDYDCEICCRPMIISFYEESGDAFAEARGIHD
ncbi:MAG: CPXCG motif-containing cysteine-rich protein [Verrucomicrobiota bacterium]